MKSTAVNTLNYTGIVTLSQYIGRKKVEIAQVQNAGAHSLFNFFSDCLLGDFNIAKDNRPTKIMLLHKSIDAESEKVSYSSESGFIYLTSNPEKIYSDTEGIVRYSFIVTRDHLEGAVFNSIGLYADSASDLYPNDFAAVVSVPDSVNLQSLAFSSALVIDWELHISNKETTINV